MTSRPKRKCHRARTKSIASDPRDTERPSPAKLIPADTAIGELDERAPNSGDRSRSRPKKRCLFRPGKHRTHSQNPEAGQALIPAHTSGEVPSHLPPLSGDYLEFNDHEFTIAPDRPTLTMPMTQRRSPFSHYKDRIRAGPSSPGPDPYRFLYRKLGVTAAEFEDRTTEEIEELFQEIEAERRQALLESLPCERVLSKADCRQMFQNIGIPTTGSLLGVYRWAHTPEDHASTSFLANTHSTPPGLAEPPRASNPTGSTWSPSPPRSRENANG